VILPNAEHSKHISEVAEAPDLRTKTRKVGDSRFVQFRFRYWGRRHVPEESRGAYSEEGRGGKGGGGGCDGGAGEAAVQEGAERGRGREAKDDRRGIEDSDVGYRHDGARHHRQGT